MPSFAFVEFAILWFAGEGLAWLVQHPASPAGALILLLLLAAAA